MRALPADASPGEVWKAPHGVLPTLQPGDLSQPFATTFEAAAQRWQENPQAYFELDGSLLLTGWRGDWFWRLEGNLYDRNDSLLFVELRIDCPQDVFIAAIETLTPNAKRIFELPGEGVFVDEATLCEHAFAAK